MAKKISSRLFNATKLEPNNQVNGRYYSDGSDLLANRGFIIDITHVPSGKQLFFKAFIMNYNETFSPDWAEESVYGRVDPIYQFKQTTRNISLGFQLPAASESEAFENLAKVQALTQFLYPNYTEAGSATTIAQSPLLRLGVMNLGRSQKQWKVADAEGGFQQTPTQHGETFNGTYAPARSQHDGLLGILKSLTVNHNLEGEAGVIERSGPSDIAMGGIVLPKLIEINFDFAVIHETHLGWDGDGNFTSPAFPYGLDFEGSGPTNPGGPGPPPAITAAQIEQAKAEEGREVPDQALANANATLSQTLQSSTETVNVIEAIEFPSPNEDNY